jgi:TPR repeat protein
MLEFGRALDYDPKAARELYEKAVSEGVAEASEGLKRLGPKPTP